MNSEKAISAQLLMFRAIQNENAVSDWFISPLALALTNVQCQRWDWIFQYFSSFPDLTIALRSWLPGVCKSNSKPCGWWGLSQWAVSAGMISVRRGLSSCEHLARQTYGALKEREIRWSNKMHMQEFVHFTHAEVTLENFLEVTDRVRSCTELLSIKLFAGLICR